MKKLLLTGIALVGAALVFAQPRLVAHRGFYTTPGSDENTVSSLINAQRLGVYGVEFDVNRTSDGELIVVHAPKSAIGSTRKGTHMRRSAGSYCRAAIGYLRSANFWSRAGRTPERS